MSHFIQQRPPVLLPTFPVPLLRCVFHHEHFYDGLFNFYDIHFPAHLYQASLTRRAEYLAGRYLAQQLMQQVGYRKVQLLSDLRGAPIWPSGVFGSISHTHEMAVCALHTSSFIGIDVENMITAEEAQNLSPIILTRQETRYFRQQSLPFNNLLTIAFSAKESAYKALSHRHTIHDFHTLQLTSLDPVKHIFHCQVDREMYCGRYIIEDGRVFTALCL